MRDLVLLTMVTSACAGTRPMAGASHSKERLTNDDSVQTAEIAKVLSAYRDAVIKEDMTAYAATMFHGPETVNFGSEGDPVVGWAAVEKVMQEQFSGLSQVEVEATKPVIRIDAGGTMAWATNLWTFKGMAGDKPLEEKLRCTWILEKIEGKWLIIHWHKSVSAG